MKRLLSVLLAVLLIFCLCGCQEEQSNEPENTRSTTYTRGCLVVSEQYDGRGDLIQRVEYNTNTGVTIIYNYSWFQDGWGKVCNKITVVTVASDGTIIEQTD